MILSNTNHESSTSDYESYDNFPYASQPFTISHPSHLAAIAHLFNINSVSTSKARILELGCASGGNIIPLAIYFPNATVVGVDYSAVQVNEGNQQIQALGLKNIELKHMSIADITAEMGAFDYIICHGVFSWISKDIQDHIFRVCSENLSENGLVYISYNTYPGWKTQEILRDAMLFHTRHVKNPAQKVTHSFEMVNYMQEKSHENSIMRFILNDRLPDLKNHAPYYIAHEYLETHNQPCYLTDFCNRAQAFGLNYLGDAEISTMFASNYGQDVVENLNKVSENNQVIMEQYLDFLTNRTFRSTILYKPSEAKKLDYNIKLIRLQDLAFLSTIKEVPPAEGAPANEPIKFMWGNQWISSSNPFELVVLRALQKLGCNFTPYKDLETLIKKELGASFNIDTFLNFLMFLIQRKIALVQKTPTDLTFANTLPQKPNMAPLVKQYAQLTQRATNMANVPVPSSILHQYMLNYIDGKHTIEDIEAEVKSAVKQGVLNFTDSQNNQQITEEPQLSEVVKAHVLNHLNVWLQQGLLMA